jgi:hypothetical protein
MRKFPYMKIYFQIEVKKMPQFAAAAWGIEVFAQGADT